MNKLETAMHLRNLPWHGQGVVVNEAPTAEEAIRLAGLDWEVIQKPISCDGVEFKSRLGNIREHYNPETGETEKYLLGIVSPDYHPVQNWEAFDFFDSLIGEEARYEIAGCVGYGKKIFLTTKMEKRWTVGDDDIDTYLLLSNGHDGYNSLKAAVTPIRIACRNALLFAFKKARRIWSIPHYSTIKEKISEARKSLQLTGIYMDEFVEFGNRACDIKVTPGVLEGLVEELFIKNSGKSSQKTKDRKIQAFEECLRKPDILPYAGTMWGVLNAVSDYETHRGKQASIMKKVLNGRLSKLSTAQKFLLNAI